MILISSLVELSLFKGELVEFNEEMKDFFKSLEDGTVFDGVSKETWKLVQRIVENNKEIVDGI